MIIDLNALDGSSKSVELEIPISGIDLGIEYARLSGPVRLECEIARAAFQTRVAGSIASELDVDCTRCLTSVSAPIAFDFAIEYVDAEHFGSEGEHEIDAKNLSADSLDKDQLDLNEVVREQLLLNLPDRVLCTENCKGLCETCGANRNSTDCDCKQEEIDPRWAALQDLK